MSYRTTFEPNELIPIKSPISLIEWFRNVYKLYMNLWNAHTLCKVLEYKRITYASPITLDITNFTSLFCLLIVFQVWIMPSSVWAIRHTNISTPWVSWTDFVQILPDSYLDLVEFVQNSGYRHLILYKFYQIHICNLVEFVQNLVTLAIGIFVDEKLEQLGGKRIHKLGLGDDDSNLEVSS